MATGNGNRVAVVGGARTPFVKAGTVFSQYTMQQLGAHATKGLVERSGIDPATVDEFIFSTVLLDPRTPNWAREIWFAAGLPKSVYAYAVSNNCISGLVAAACGANSIALGRARTVIAGGTESMSNPALLFSEHGSAIFLKLSRAKSVGQKLALLAQFRPRSFMPKPPAPTEPSTGLTMGQHMEITAKQLGIARSGQDEVAFLSHRNAGAATADGRLTADIVPLGGVTKDLLIRADTSLEKLSQLKPVFDRSSAGTLTAGNSSALTDGASAVLLMSEAQAQKEKREPIAYITDFEFGAIDANDGLLMAPGVVVPRLLRRCGLTFNDFDLIEVHEAFGAQVVANIKAWEEGWKESKVGSFPRERMNVMGGSIAIGHPFAATGGRILSGLAAEMKRRGAKRGLISICAAGAMAGAMILER